MSSLLLRRGLFAAAASKTLTRPLSVRFASTDSSLYEVREKPQSVSYFTGNYKYNDLLIELDALHKKYADWQGDGSALQQQVNAWKLREKMSQMLAIPLKTSQWRKIVAHLNTLAALPKPLPQPVEQALAPYQRYDQEQQQQQQASTSKTLDALGRAFAVGRRKESSARCYVVEGDGQVLVNGMTLEEYFKRPVDRDEVKLPLEVTENKESFNVWALVNGGGSTGNKGGLDVTLPRGY